MVSDDIMIALLSKEFDGKPSHISNSICASLFTSSGTDSTQNWCFLSNTMKELGPCYMGNVIRDFKFPPCTRGFGMDNPTWVSQTSNLESRGEPAFPEFVHD